MNYSKWEFIGVVFIVLIGFFLHMAYDLFDKNQFVALVAPINESIWEHLKMAFYGMLIYAAFEYIFVGKDTKNFIFAKAFSSLIACFLFVVFYYGYTEFLAQSIYLDIIIFIVAILVAQTFSFAFLKSKFYISGMNYIGLLIIIGTIFVFCSYTYEPASSKLFIEFLKHEINL